MDLRAGLSRYGDVVLAASLAALITGELLAWDRDVGTAAVAMGLLATGPLVLRRRAPLVSFLLVMAGVELLSLRHPGFDNGSMAFVATFFVALYSLGRHARGLEAWLGAAGVVLAMVLFVASESGLGATLGDVAFVTAFAGAPWAAGLTLRLRREREADLRAENAQLQAEQEARARRAVAEERSRIARELHDVVSHAISVTVLQARGARRMLGTDETAVRRALEAIEATNTSALGDMRRLLTVLRETDDAEGEGDAAPPTEPDRSPQPSLDQLDRLVDQVRSSGVDVSLEVSGDPASVPPGVELSAYRIVQEGLTNVVRHAGPATAVVRLTYAPTELQISVRDDGAGPQASAGNGHGLLGIRERVAVAGGSVEAGPCPEGGFEVRARLPYAAGPS